MKKYIIRLDDISWDMNYENFMKIKKIFLKHEIKPIIGIIPNNKDVKLKAQVGKIRITQNDFWEEMRELQSIHGWAIALHGYDHVYTSSNGGMFNNNNRAEFAGLSYEIQHEKISKGKKILEINGLSINAFMAPAHSLDWTTVEVLLKNGIECVTDGSTAYPYTLKGMKFIPQQWSWPHWGVYGIETNAFHINTWDEKRFAKLEHFLQGHAKQCISFIEVLDNIEIYNKWTCKVLNWCTRKVLPLNKGIYTALSKFKRRIMR